MTVLVTGGAGFIGSHTCAELAGHGESVVVIDDYSNSSPSVLACVRELGGGRVTGYQADLRDAGRLDEIFARHEISTVIHFAALKSVSESVRVPRAYYEVNVGGTLSLLGSMHRHDVTRLVFSSSCSVYGDQRRKLISEDCQPRPANPYARSKLMCEQVLADACTAWPGLSVISLRYFNPIGAHPGGRIGERQRGLPDNLMPLMTAVATGRAPVLRVYGGDYPTPDGTAIRDYVHVMDIAEAHLLAMRHLDDHPGMRSLNVGTGTGVSVLQLIAEFGRACGKNLPYEIAGRRPGDVASLVADPGLIRSRWGWQPTRNLRQMCQDAWHFTQLGHELAEA